MSKLMVAIVVAGGILVAGSAAGQPLPLPSQPGPVAKSVTSWTAGGVGGGFGLGFVLGMGAFDDAVNSEKKIWTSAIVGAAVGGTIGYLVGRSRRSTSQMPSLNNRFTVEQAALISQKLDAQLAKSVTFTSRSVSAPAADRPR